MSTYAEKTKVYTELSPQHNILQRISPASHVLTYEIFGLLIEKFVTEKMKLTNTGGAERWIKESFAFRDSIQKITQIIDGDTNPKLITSEKLYLKALFLVNPFLIVNDKLTLNRLFINDYS